MYHPEPAKHLDKQSKTGILLINLGTPEAPTAKAVRPYLREFLSDPRVVELPRWLWWPVLHGIILTFRPAKSAQKYAQIWLPEGSPLKVHTERQTKLLKGALGEMFKLHPPFPALQKSTGTNQLVASEQALAEDSPLWERGARGDFTTVGKTPEPAPPPPFPKGGSERNIVVDYAMSYGAPSITSTLARLKAEGCDRILALPLYPQYAASSTASALDAVFDTLAHTRNQPALRTVKDFHNHPAYIAALEQSVRDHWMLHGRGDMLLMSFHGIPRKSVDLGDPYQRQCLVTGQLLAQALGLGKEQYRIAFQSRFGAAEWLKPYTVDTLTELGKRGVKQVDVMCPGFVADCLETLEEIAMEGKAVFLNAGGKEFRYIPALNERPDWIAALADIVLSNLEGWLTR